MQEKFFFVFFFWSSIVTRCKTYRESRYRTAGRGEGVTSRCQTVPWLRDVPKGAHNWFQISQSTVLLISVNGNSGSFIPIRMPNVRQVQKNTRKKNTHSVHKIITDFWFHSCTKFESSRDFILSSSSFFFFFTYVLSHFTNTRIHIYLWRSFFFFLIIKKERKDRQR